MPVKIATSSSSLWRNSVQVSASAVRISWLSALSRSGRFMRTTRIWPWRSVSTTGMGGLLWRRGLFEQASSARRMSKRTGMHTPQCVAGVPPIATCSNVHTFDARWRRDDHDLIQPRIQPGHQRAKRAAQKGPVFITDRGRPAHVLLTIEDYQKLTGAPANIVDMLAMPGAADIDFEPPRCCMSLIRMSSGTR